VFDLWLYDGNLRTTGTRHVEFCLAIKLRSNFALRYIYVLKVRNVTTEQNVYRNLHPDARIKSRNFVIVNVTVVLAFVMQVKTYEGNQTSFAYLVSCIC